MQFTDVKGLLSSSKSFVIFSWMVCQNTIELEGAQPCIIKWNVGLDCPYDLVKITRAKNIEQASYHITVTQQDCSQGSERELTTSIIISAIGKLEMFLNKKKWTFEHF